MATFKVEIAVNNATFEDSEELSRLLRNLADRVEVQTIDGHTTHNGGSYTLMDYNGNAVGTAWIEED